MRKTICAAVATICFFWGLGLVGSFELDKIGFAGLVAQGVPVLAVLYASIKIGGFDK